MTPPTWPSSPWTSSLPQPKRTCFDADPSIVIAFEDDKDTASIVGFHHYHIVVTYKFHDGVWAIESFCSCCRCSFHNLGGTRQISLLVSYFR
ncbi:uncharacterized protein LOC119291639 isoform X2 [Triticum dicoccoides]|nr:uncharacterized protein LOC119291639 isoform X2 [Triticum dicoccoides]